MLNNKYDSFFNKDLCECINKCEKENSNTKKDIENETQKIQNSLHRYLRHLIMFENNNVSEQTMLKERDRFHTEAFSNIWYLLENIKRINKLLNNITLETKTDDSLFNFIKQTEDKEHSYSDIDVDNIEIKDINDNKNGDKDSLSVKDESLDNGWKKTTITNVEKNKKDNINSKSINSIEIQYKEDDTVIKELLKNIKNNSLFIS